MGQRVELLGTSQSVDGFVVSLERREHVSVELVDVRAAGVLLECPLELELGAAPIEIDHASEEGRRAVRFTQAVVELERFRDGLAGLSIRLARLQRTRSVREAELRVCHRQPDVGEGVARVLHDRVLEILDPFADPFLGISEGTMAPLEIQLVGLEVPGGLPTKPGLLIRRELCFERRGDPQRHIGLDHEDVGQVPVVGLRPEMVVGLGVDELGDDAHPISVAPHAPFEQRRDIQAGSDLAQALLPLLERHHRSARDHGEGADLRQLRDDVLGDPVGEVLVRRVRAQVRERQHRDRLGPGTDRTRLGERLRERGRGGEPVGWDRRERSQQGLLDAPWHGGPEAPHAGRRTGEALGDHCLRGGSGVRRLAGQQLIQDAPQAVHVAAGIQ